VSVGVGARDPPPSPAQPAARIARAAIQTRNARLCAAIRQRIPLPEGEGPEG
jgi:hypothetical protein